MAPGPAQRLAAALLDSFEKYLPLDGLVHHFLSLVLIDLLLLCESCCVFKEGGVVEIGLLEINQQVLNLVRKVLLHTELASLGFLKKV